MASHHYNHKEVEGKWQSKWSEAEIYKTPNDARHKKYVLDMFPYPSGSSMHVGHLEGYIGTDILSRYFRMRGFKVLHPMGWDSFGLPAENYAIKTGVHPDKSTHQNVKTFKRQLISSGLSYDWEREIDTSSPDFYRWTQWLFISMFKKGLVYKKKSPVNWCPKDETVLANEQVINGKCERCDAPVVLKELDQWFFKITQYADRLISGLDSVDWLPEIKAQQKNWIGKSEGMKIRFGKIEVFTTRPDTLNSATFIAVDSKSKTENYERLGKFTGAYVINPLTAKKIPVWEASYVDANYGTGAVMGVPAYDERDREFAEKYHLDIVKMEPDESLWKKVEKEGWGKRATIYHLRDWLISRQRYWGAPIPMIYCDECGWQPVADTDLPIKLPIDVDFLPTGESPIARSKTFAKNVVCPKCGKTAKREVDTMDGFVDSSWYFVRFTDPHNKEVFAAKEKMKEWLPVDIYVGGGHVVQHLLFSRFIWKFLYDGGYVDKSIGDEPFLKLRSPGWILGPDSRKMSKRWNNVVTPDDIIPKFGADVLRLYEMFMGPFDIVKPWSINGVEGMNRFLGRVWDLFNSDSQTPLEDDESRVNIRLHQTIKKVTTDIESLKFNTAISSIMELVNFLKENHPDRFSLKVLAQLLAPFAPFMMEEVWNTVLGEKGSVHFSSWPIYDPKKVVSNTLIIPIQVDGKLRGQIEIPSSLASNKEEVLKNASSSEKINQWVEKGIEKSIYIKGKLINFVTKKA